MFNRKVLLMALLAVTLLVSLMDGSVIKDRKRGHKRATVAGGIAAVVQTMPQTSLTNLMNKVTGLEADDSDNQQLSFGDKRGRRKPRVYIETAGLNQVTAGITADDPNNYQARPVKPRRPRRA